MNLTPIVLIGAGGHATVVVEIILKQGLYRIAGYTSPEERPQTECWRFDYLGDDNVLPSIRKKGIALAALGVGSTGDNRLRCRLYEAAHNSGFILPLLVHPSAVIANGVLIADGSVIAPGAVINPGSKIGVNTVINSAAVIEHDCLIGDHVHVSPGAVLCGGVSVKSFAHVGAGAVVIQGINVGDGAVVGAGAVVIDDVEPWTVVAGNPAKVMKRLVEQT